MKLSLQKASKFLKMTKYNWIGSHIQGCSQDFLKGVSKNSISAGVWGARAEPPAADKI